MVGRRGHTGAVLCCDVVAHVLFQMFHTPSLVGCEYGMFICRILVRVMGGRHCRRLVLWIVRVA